jgi:hypothetical protein
MKKIISILIIKLLIVTNLFANDNSGNIQVFVSKTNGLTSVGQVEELFTGSQSELAEVSAQIMNNEKNLIQNKIDLQNGITNSRIESKNEIMSTENAVKAGAVGAVATVGAVSAAAVGSGKTISDGLAAIGATVGAVAIYNGTQGMRNDFMYISLYRNTVDNKTGLLYVTVVSNSELKREEIRAEVEKVIKK